MSACWRQRSRPWTGAIAWSSPPMRSRASPPPRIAPCSTTSCRGSSTGSISPPPTRFSRPGSSGGGMSESTVPLGRRWNSWDAEHPAAMRYLPLGLDLELCAYAASRNSFTRIPSGAEGLRLGPRRIDGDGIELDLVHAGTELRVAYDKPDPFTLRGRWQAGRMPEWGLRFWVMLALHSADGAEWVFDPETGVLATETRGRRVAVAGER